MGSLGKEEPSVENGQEELASQKKEGGDSKTRTGKASLRVKRWERLPRQRNLATKSYVQALVTLSINLNSKLWCLLLTN